LSFFRTRSRRFWPAFVGVAALASGLAVASVGGGVTNPAPKAQLAAAQRHADLTANRGSARDDLVSSQITTTTTVPPTTSTTAAPTTTTVAPKPTTTTTAAPKPVVASSGANSQSGGASYYSQPWAAKGCAHKTLPKGTVVTVTNVANGKSTTCVINDRGPYVAGRIIDMDTSLFAKIASTSQGVAQVRISW
jgi:rare lipoprotein A (peptidoglycan hydrolase)